MSKSLTSVERVQTAVDGGTPDRVPVTLHNFMMAAHAYGMPFPAYFQNGEAMAEGMLRAWREFGHDMVILENGTAALAQACGCGVEYLPDSAPVLVQPVLTSLDDIDKLRVPNPHTTHPLPELLKTTRIVSREIGDQAYILGRADQGPFSLASMLLGVDEFLMALTDPDNHAKLHRLLQFSLEVVYRYALAQGEAGARMTSIGESLAGPDVSSPRIYREFEWDYARQLAERLKAHRLPLAYHICGNATSIARDMAATGAAVLELDYKCDLHAIKDAARGKCAILGVVDPSGIMALGTPDMVTQQAREDIEVLGAGGGLILSPGCALPPTTPPENVHALVEAARRYGA